MLRDTGNLNKTLEYYSDRELCQRVSNDRWIRL
jgi:hypothetical protein